MTSEPAWSPPLSTRSRGSNDGQAPHDAGDPAAGLACTAVGLVLTWQGQPDAAEPWVQRAERTLSAETQPAAVLAIRYIRGTLELERDRNAAALAALEAGEPLARRLAGQHYFAARLRALLVHALIRLGQAERAGQFLAGPLGEQDRDRGGLGGSSPRGQRSRCWSRSAAARPACCATCPPT